MRRKLIFSLMLGMAVLFAADVNAQLGGVRVFRNANQAKPALAIFGP